MMRCSSQLLLIELSGLSGLSAGATLDVRQKSNSAAPSRASVALQLPSGRRLQGEFDGSATLWSLLQHFENESKEKITLSTDSSGKVLAPTLVFMNREVRTCVIHRVLHSLTIAQIDYSSLRTVTLAAAGISGSSLLRLIAKPTGKTVQEFEAEVARLDEQQKQEQAALQKQAEEERLKRLEQEKAHREREAAMKQARDEERLRIEANERRLREEAEREDRERAEEEERLRIADERRRAEEERRKYVE